MAVLATILPVVGRSAILALQLYKCAATLHDEAATDLTRAAKSIRAFSSVLKQVGTIIKEDDLLISHEAIEVLENVIDQARLVFSEIENCVPNSNIHNDKQWNGIQDGSQPNLSTYRLNYLSAHLEALKAILAVMLQTLHTAQSIMWSQLAPAVSPQKVEEAVANEKTLLQAVIIEQQSAVLFALQAYEGGEVTDSRLLMVADSPQSLILLDHGTSSPLPSDLHRFQDKFIVSLGISKSNEIEWLPSICSIAAPHSKMLLECWSSLPEFYHRIRQTQQEEQTQKRETLQPMVESDEEDDSDQRQKMSGNRSRRASKTKDSGYEPLFTEADRPAPSKRDSRYNPLAPLSPAASPRTSRQSVGSSIEQDSPTSARSSICSLPVEATAAIEAKEEDDDVDLEIPWTLCTRKCNWQYIDNKVIRTNTDQLPSIAYLERNSWTEVMASWVCKEAIKAMGYRVSQVQKEKRDGRRTRFETCFCIEQPLQFQQVKQLVERTVEIYRRTKPATPPPPPPQHVRRSSFNRPSAPPQIATYHNPVDRDRTPVPPKRSTHPPLDRSTTALHVPPAMPPKLDRSMSNPPPMSGLDPIPGPPAAQQTKGYPSNLHIPMPLPQYSTSMPHGQFPPPPPLQGQPPYSAYNSPQVMYPPKGAFGAPLLPPHMQPHNMGMPQSPLRHTRLHPHSRAKYEDDYTTTDSDSTDRDRRRHRSKSRSRYTSEKKKKSHNKSKAAGALLGVGGLTALLDGLSGF